LATLATVLVAGFAALDSVFFDTGVLTCAEADLLTLTGDFTAGFTVAREAALGAGVGVVLTLGFAATFVAALLAGLVDDFTATAFFAGVALTVVLIAALAAVFTEAGFAAADLVAFTEAVCFLTGFFIAVAMESSITE